MLNTAMAKICLSNTLLAIEIALPKICIYLKCIELKSCPKEEWKILNLISTYMLVVLFRSLNNFCLFTVTIQYYIFLLITCSFQITNKPKTMLQNFRTTYTILIFQFDDPFRETFYQPFCQVSSDRLQQCDFWQQTIWCSGWKKMEQLLELVNIIK